ncbi:MAG: C10 family peptidase [Chitinophagales bacterium]
MSPINQKYFVSKATAMYIAEHFHFFLAPKNNAKTTSTLSVKDITEIKDNNNNTAYYLFNYNDDRGYLFLSADYRQEAAFGFGENGLADINNMPPQLKYLIDEEIKEIDFLRNNEVDSIEQVPEETWEMFALPPDENLPGLPDEEGNCGEAYSYTKGPLLQTEWGQDRGGIVPYNDLCPIPNGCSFKAPTGCVATAMAQIMYYHKKPASYNWNLMYTGNQSSAECARLMRDAGNSVDMSYTCTLSGANSRKVDNALINTFGYASSTNYRDYGSGPTQVEIDNYRPVYLSAVDQHAWVCDGYRYFLTGCSGIFWPHMNWGWNGDYNNYFGFNDWSPGGYSFNGERKMIVIRK